MTLKGDVDNNSLRDEDMVYLMGMQSKELHKLCGRLREDRFLAVYATLHFVCARRILIDILS
jgi:hypothetical protein